MDLPAEVVVVPDPTGQRVDLTEAIEILGNRGIVDLLVEGGTSLTTSLRVAGLIDRGVIYAGAVLAGGAGRGVFEGVFGNIGDLQPIRITGLERIGPDIKIEFEGAD